MNVQEIVNNRYGKGIAQCSNEEIYYALLEMTKSMAKEKESNEGKRKLYYISAEFLIGKLLSNNLINLGIYEEVKQVLAEKERTWQRSRRLSRSRLSETAVWVVWQHASWIPLQRSD